MNPPKLLVIHRALAPYRIDLFNQLANHYQTQIWFEFDEAIEQRFHFSPENPRLQFTSATLPQGTLHKNLRLSLFKIVRQFKPDLILCSEINLLTAILLMARRLYAPQAPLLSICDDNVEQATLTLQKRPLKRAILQQIDGAIFCSQQVTQLYTHHLGTEPDHFFYFPIVQDETYLRHLIQQQLPQAVALREQLGIAPDERILLYVGRLTEVKNLPFLLTTFLQFSKTAPEWKLLLVGDGNQAEQLHQQFGHHPQILFVGKKEGPELFTHYALADAFVLPSTNELFGAVTGEALAAGLYSLISTHAGSSELIGRQQGETFSPTHQEAFLAALQRMRHHFLSQPAWSPHLQPSLLDNSFAERIQQLLLYLQKCQKKRP